MENDDAILKDARVLLVRPCALGDAVVTTPVLHALFEAGAREIVILGKPASWDFLREDARIRVEDFGSSRWLPLFKEGASLGEAERALLHDITAAVVYLSTNARVVDEALVRCGVRKVLHGDPPRIDTRAADLVFVGLERGCAEGLEGIPSCSATRLLLAPLACWLGEALIGKALRPALFRQSEDPLMRITDAERAQALDEIGLNEQPATGFFAIHPGSGGSQKCWPVGRFMEVLKKAKTQMGLAPLLLFGPADAEVRAAFEAARLGGFDAMVFSNRSPRTVAILLSMSRMYLGNDSGVSHLAGRCCPTIVLFGPTDPDVWRPLGPWVKVVLAGGGPGVKMQDLPLASVETTVQALMKETDRDGKQSGRFMSWL